MARKIKAVIFDMDGVLIDAKEWHYECLNEALDKFGMAIGRQEHLTTFDGLPTRKKLEILSRERQLPVQLHEFLNDLKQLYTTNAVAQKCRPNFVHEYALSRLSAQGYKLAVASNSIRQTVGLMMDRANLLRYLEFYISNEDVSKPKPDPEMYITAIERLGFKPEECVIVEDNDHGIRAAKASGANVLKVETVHDVNLSNITRFISECEA